MKEKRKDIRFTLIGLLLAALGVFVFDRAVPKYLFLILGLLFCGYGVFIQIRNRKQNK